MNTNNDNGHITIQAPGAKEFAAVFDFENCNAMVSLCLFTDLPADKRAEVAHQLLDEALKALGNVTP